MKTYYGWRKDGEAEVGVRLEDGGPLRALPWRLDLANHSPTGLEWGYGGSGPAQCALAILADCLGDDQRALQLYQDFKFNVIGRLPRDIDQIAAELEVDDVAGQQWKLTEQQVRAAVDRLIAENPIRYMTYAQAQAIVHNPAAHNEQERNRAAVIILSREGAADNDVTAAIAIS